MVRPPSHSPAERATNWPEQASSDPGVEAARLFVLALRSAIGDRSIRSVARLAGLDEGTVRRTLSGQTWPDIRTIALLELALGVPLYTPLERVSSAHVTT